MTSRPTNLPLPFMDGFGVSPSVASPAPTKSRRGSRPSPGPDDAELRHLKLVSKAKLEILKRYLVPWARILGSGNFDLAYVDCFAGPGRYHTREGEVDGSAVIAVRTARDYCAQHPGHRMRLVLMDKDEAVIRHLNRNLSPHRPYGPRLTVDVRHGDCRDLVPALLRDLPASLPAFVTIDPYNHPLPIPVINQILRRPRSEVFINLMFYQINRDLNNPVVRHKVDALFGHTEWRDQPFMQESGWKRERGFLEYFRSQLEADYVLPFRVLFDEQEDRVRGDRTKYYLLHGSNHPKAMLLMKDVMWRLGDEAGTFQYAAKSHSRLISQAPDLAELREALSHTFFDREVSFEEMQVETWELPYIEKHYREAIKAEVAAGCAVVSPVDSKTERGLKGRDRVRIFMF